jgi:hypothetical protein
MMVDGAPAVDEATATVGAMPVFRGTPPRPYSVPSLCCHILIWVTRSLSAPMCMVYASVCVCMYMCVCVSELALLAGEVTATRAVHPLLALVVLERDRRAHRAALAHVRPCPHPYPTYLPSAHLSIHLSI